MTSERVQVLLGALIFTVAFLGGVRASINITRRYRTAMGAIDARNRPVLLLITAVCWFITFLAGWIGGLSIFRLVAEVALPWTPPITLFLATLTVLIPQAFYHIIAWVAGEPTRLVRAVSGLSRTPPDLTQGHPSSTSHEDEDKEVLPKP